MYIYIFIICVYIYTTIFNQIELVEYRSTVLNACGEHPVAMALVVSSATSSTAFFCSINLIRFAVSISKASKTCSCLFLASSLFNSLTSIGAFASSPWHAWTGSKMVTYRCYMMQFKMHAVYTLQTEHGNVWSSNASAKVWWYPADVGDLIYDSQKIFLKFEGFTNNDILNDAIGILAPDFQFHWGLPELQLM